MLGTTQGLSLPYSQANIMTYKHFMGTEEGTSSVSVTKNFIPQGNGSSQNFL